MDEIVIRPVSDVDDFLEEIEEITDSGRPVYLTKDGYSALVVISPDKYAELTAHPQNYLRLSKDDIALLASALRNSENDIAIQLKEEQ